MEHPGGAADAAERRKVEKYRNLSTNYQFSPLGFETLGSWGTEARRVVSTIGKLMSEQTCDPRSSAFLYQRVSIEIQRGNAYCVLGSLPRNREIEDSPFRESP